VIASIDRFFLWRCFRNSASSFSALWRSLSDPQKELEEERGVAGRTTHRKEPSCHVLGGEPSGADNRRLRENAIAGCLSYNEWRSHEAKLG